MREIGEEMETQRVTSIACYEEKENRVDREWIVVFDYRGTNTGRSINIIGLIWVNRLSTIRLQCI